MEISPQVQFIKLVKSGFHVLILEIAHPSAIRRNVAFSEAVYEEKWQVEDMTCHLAHDIKEAEQIMKAGNPALNGSIQMEK